MWHCKFSLALLLTAGFRLTAQVEEDTESPEQVQILEWALRIAQAEPLEQFQLLDELAASGSRVGPALPQLMLLIDDPLCRDQVLRCLRNAGRDAIPFLIGLLPSAELHPGVRGAESSLFRGSTQRQPSPSW